MTATQAPTPGPLDSESVKLLVKGDWISHPEHGTTQYRPSAADDRCLTGPWSFVGRPDADGWIDHKASDAPPPDYLMVEYITVSGLTSARMRVVELRWDRDFKWRPFCLAPTPGPLSAQHEEAIAFNLCSLRGFDPAFVNTQRDFALAVIKEYERARPSLTPAAPVEASGSEREAAGPGGWLIRESDGGWLWTGTRIAAVAALTEGNEVVALRPQPSGETREIAAFSKIRELLSYANQDGVSAEVAENNRNIAWHTANNILKLSARPLALGGQQGDHAELIADLRRYHDDCTPSRMDYALSDGLAFALEKAIKALSTTPARAEAQDEDMACTDCGDTGVTHQTERRCSCQEAEAQDEGAAGEPELAASLSRMRFLLANVEEGVPAICDSPLFASYEFAADFKRIVDFAAAHPSPTPAADDDRVRIAVPESEWRDAIALILPLAKGYAAANRVGSNQSYVDHAEALLATPECPDADKLRPIIDEATHAVLPPVDDVTGFGTQARAAMQVEIADRILAALKSTAAKEGGE